MLSTHLKPETQDKLAKAPVHRPVCTPKAPCTSILSSTLSLRGQPVHRMLCTPPRARAQAAVHAPAAPAAVHIDTVSKNWRLRATPCTDPCARPPLQPPPVHTCLGSPAALSVP